MNELLKSLSNKNNVELEVVETVLEIEKKSVYKKKRFIFGDLRNVIEKGSLEEKKNDN